MAGTRKAGLGGVVVLGAGAIFVGLAYFLYAVSQYTIFRTELSDINFKDVAVINVAELMMLGAGVLLITIGWCADRIHSYHATHPGDLVGRRRRRAGIAMFLVAGATVAAGFLFVGLVGGLEFSGIVLDLPVWTVAVEPGAFSVGFLLGASGWFVHRSGTAWGRGGSVEASVPRSPVGPA
jgi:hypothetical protein